MANNYSDMTGTLVLNRVTPVIKALFGSFELDEAFPGDGNVYVACISETTNDTWEAVSSGLLELITSLGLKIPDEDEESVPAQIEALAAHFGASGNENLQSIIDSEDFDGCAGMDSLFAVAMAFDDGHGLKAFQGEASWTCSKPRLFEFGGAGMFISASMHLATFSHTARSMGEALDSALELGDTDAAAAVLRKQMGNYLAAINDCEMREATTKKLAALLA